MRRNTVLVVDDTPETLSFLTDMLDGAGFTVLIATDGECALALVDQITPDLVLMDALMPGVNGFETCRRLKADKLLVHVPVIFMTALSETEHVVQGFAAGGVDYVTKPIVVEQLLARIRVHLANARLAQGTRIALDASGRFLLAADSSGRLLWCTPKARQLIRDLLPPDPGHAPPSPALLEQLRTLPASAAKSVLLTVGAQQIELTYLSSTGPGERLFRVTEISADEELLRENLELTEREAEVLLWISRGKSNREIGDILTISPRTVNKHLEQIFVKLGVENRAGAAARAVRTLAR